MADADQGQEQVPPDQGQEQVALVLPASMTKEDATIIVRFDVIFLLETRWILKTFIGLLHDIMSEHGSKIGLTNRKDKIWLLQ
jgi:hypothetical protein